MALYDAVGPGMCSAKGLEGLPSRHEGSEKGSSVRALTGGFRRTGANKDRWNDVELFHPASHPDPDHRVMLLYTS